jgi:hypothetical protein
MSDDQRLDQTGNRARVRTQGGRKWEDDKQYLSGHLKKNRSFRAGTQAIAPAPVANPSPCPAEDARFEEAVAEVMAAEPQADPVEELDRSVDTDRPVAEVDAEEAAAAAQAQFEQECSDYADQLFAMPLHDRTSELSKLRRENPDTYDIVKVRLDELDAAAEAEAQAAPVEQVDEVRADADSQETDAEEQPEATEATEDAGPKE